MHLETFVELVADARPGHASFEARLDAVLDDGRRIVVLDDRGWTMASHPRTDDPWAGINASDVAEIALVVVGPDEPFDDRTEADMDADHFAALAATLREAEVHADATVLAALPNRVVLGPALRAHLAQ